MCDKLSQTHIWCIIDHSDLIRIVVRRLNNVGVFEIFAREVLSSNFFAQPKLMFPSAPLDPIKHADANQM